MNKFFFKGMKLKIKWISSAGASEVDEALEVGRFDHQPLLSTSQFCRALWIKMPCKK